MLRYFLLLVFAIILSACNSTQNISKVTQQADLLYYNKDYPSAFDAYSKIIENCTAKGLPVPGHVYSGAGKSLYYSGSPKQAMDFFSLADENGDTEEETLLIRIKYYASLDNLSKELDNLEKYSALFSDGAEIQFVNKRLFLRYLEMKEYRKAYIRYVNMSEADKDDIAILEKYYTVCDKLERTDEANKTAQLIYDRNPNSLIGLGYVAYNAYISVEDEYVAAIKAYEAKKTAANYRILQQKTAGFSSRYKTAKNYYVKLYNLYKRPHDAAILSRICTRLNDKKNAAYYEKLSKQN